MVMEVVLEEESVQCADHPYQKGTPGGICAFCLQEKLGKLISSSFPAAVFPSSSPSFRSDAGGEKEANRVSSAAKSGSGHKDLEQLSSRARLRVHKKEHSGIGVSDSVNIALTRSMSSATPRRSLHFLDEGRGDYDSPHRRSFWSFLRSKNSSAAKKGNGNGNPVKDTNNFAPVTPSSAVGASSGSGEIRSNEKRNGGFAAVDEDGSPDEASFDRKVPRSRSVGCGRRSFSGDFLERLSTGFGDCTLRRVESQREGKHQKTQTVGKNSLNGIKERVRFNGIFGGLVATPSSSSSSSYWIASSVHDSASASRKSISARNISQAKSKSWAWVLASPMRAFSRPAAGKKEGSSSKGSTPNLSAIPSLLTVS